MKIAQIKEMKTGELKKFVEEKKAQALSFRFDISSNQLKNVRLYRQTRKAIARALTVIAQRAGEEQK